MDYSILYYVLLAIVGFVAGIINVLAGGGSNLTLPVLMMSGMPADVANATNRIAVLFQCVTGVAGFKKHDQLDTQNIVPILIPSMLGGILGAVLAVYLPATLLKPLLLGTMLSVALLILIRPAVIAPPPGTPVYVVKERPRAWIGLFVAGVYGGFVQAGVGFILIAVLAGTLRYDLVRSNALKLVCTTAFTLLALGIFLLDGLIQWVPGVVLSIGTVVGAWIAVKIALKVNQNAMKWFLFLMTLAACAGALLPDYL